MALEIVTGYTGSAHIYSADMRALNRNIFGNGYYVLKEGGQFKSELIDNNTLRIMEGDLVMQGVHARIRTGNFVDVAINNASQGKKRNVLVCVHYYTSSDSTEKVRFECLYGKEADSNPNDPEYTNGDLSTTGKEAYFPLYRIVQNASNVEKVDKLFDTLSTMEEMMKLTSQIFLLSHPVGSIYMTTDSTNPSLRYGGTWVTWGTGRVPVGVNTADSNFNSVEKTGGANTVSLSLSQIPAHSHGLNSHTHGVGSLKVAVGSHSHSGLYHGGSDITYFSDLFAKGSYAGLRGVSGGSTVKTGNTAPSASISGNTGASSGSTANAGSGGSHNNLQPYITCYMWKRTA